MKIRARLPRIVVTGSESTGKTTLAAAIASRLATIWVPEYSRTFAEQSVFPLSVATVEPIARGQVAAEDSAEVMAQSAGHGVLVLDTDLVSTTVYAEHYYGSCPAWVVAEARERMGDLYLLCDIDLPWVRDGVRDQATPRAVLHRRFIDRLAAFGARVAPVAGEGDNRLLVAGEAIAEWRRLLAPRLRVRHIRR